MMPADILKWTVRLLGVLLVAAVLGWLLLRGNSAAVETRTVTSQVVVQEMRRVGRLELAHYFLKDVLEYRVRRETPVFGSLPWRIGSTGKVLLVVSGEAVGCVDLERIDSAAVQLTDSLLVLRLPPPELCVYKVDHQRSKVYDAEFTAFQFSDAEKSQILGDAFRQAEANLRRAALQQGILYETEAQARQFLQPLLETLTQRRVQVVFAASGKAPRQ